MRAGFTLVETLVAFAVLAAVSAALVALQVSSIRARAAAEAQHQAAALLQDELVLQRVTVDAASGPCLASMPPAVADCRVERTCVALAGDPCAIEAVAVAVEVGRSRPLEARTLVFTWLERGP